MREAANHRRRTALGKCFGLMAFTILGLAVPAAGQDRTNPAPVTEGDRKVGALGCTYAMFVLVQAVTAACGWARQPADDAIDEAIAAFDDFILANTSSHLTRPMLEDVKRHVATGHLRKPQL